MHNRSQTIIEAFMSMLPTILEANIRYKYKPNITPNRSTILRYAMLNELTYPNTQNNK